MNGTYHAEANANGWSASTTTTPNWRPRGSRMGSEMGSSPERDFSTASQRYSHGVPVSEVDMLASDPFASDPDSLPVPYWSHKRHLTCGNPTPPSHWAPRMTPWRAAPGKLKTANAALVLCLNIDVDPPDVIKTQPSAKMECWVDPHTMPSHKALEAVGQNLQHQFEGLSPKIPYKPILDPSYEDLRRFCITMRKQAKDDTVLFYYNGHGVPRPTASGELWCFNRNYTQYIPVALHDVQGWLQSPCVYIWDCSAAGHLVNNFITLAEKKDQESYTLHGGYPDGTQPFMNSILLAACAASEQLPSCPELPADLFTSCLTSPIDIALRFFVMNNPLPNKLNADQVMQIPGDLKDRRTPLGELNWIFTAITDTIAWTTFSREVFTRLYRSDLLIASLFRNFLLAERIMKNYHCNPVSHPRLPATNTHPLWASWDLAVDACLRQIPAISSTVDPDDSPPIPSAVRSKRNAQPGAKDTPPPPSLIPPYTYVPSRFFADQLTAFEVWISRGGSALTKRGPMSLPVHGSDSGSDAGCDAATGAVEATHQNGDAGRHDQHLVPRKPPEQLPIVLQVLLSQPHRLRALILLSQFVDLGPWAVHLALTIGIFPYISKLLQAAGPELRPVLIFIWARILAVDPTCQVDLYTNHGYKYFANVLGMQEEPRHLVIPNRSEHKAMCAFILASIARDFAHGQNAVWREKVFEYCFTLLDETDFLLRQWSALCIAMIWGGNDEIRIYGVDIGTQDKLIAMLTDDSPEVRAAVLFALSSFMGASTSVDLTKPGGGGSGTMNQLEERIHFRMEVAVTTGATLAITLDASPMVKKEMLVLMSCLVKEWRGYFVVCAWIYWEEERRRNGGGNLQQDDDDVAGPAVAEWLDGFGDDEMSREENRVLLSSFFTIFAALLELSVDPYPEVMANAQTLVDYIMALLLESPFVRLEGSSISTSLIPAQNGNSFDERGPRTRTHSLAPDGPMRPPLARAETATSTMSSTISSGVSSTIRRTSSFANALKSLAGGIAFPSAPSDDGGRGSPSPTASQSQSQLSSQSRIEKFLDVSRPPSPNLNLAHYTSPYSPLSAGAASSTQHKFYARSPSPPPPPQAAADFLPSDVMEALMEEDMERLRARRRTAPHPGAQSGAGGLPSPSGSTFSVDSNGSVILGLGTGVGIRDALPLKSRFFDWCAEYFKEPQMRQAEADEPGSIQYNQQVWRYKQRERVAKQVVDQGEVAEDRRWDKHVRSLQTSGCPLLMAFHAYDPYLVVANEADTISVWDWSRRRKINQFLNGSSPGTGITALHIINQEVGGMILAGSGDGIVRLYRNYDPTMEQGPLQLVSSFRAMTDIVSVRRGSGLVLDWKQLGGNLLAGGDSRFIKLWDAHTESQLVDMDTNSESPVTAIVSDQGSSSTFLASFADGVVKVFDRRLEEDDAIVRSYRAHSSWVQNVRWHPYLSGQFLSASMDGEVKLWDIRGPDGAAQTWDLTPDGVSAFDVHPQAGVFAVTTAIHPNHWRHQRAIVHSLSKHGALSSVNIPTGLAAPPTRRSPSPYIPRSSSLAFHPMEMLYSVGEPDGSVRILGCKFT